MLFDRFDFFFLVNIMKGYTGTENIFPLSVL